MHADRGQHGVRFRVDHADVVRSGIDHVNFILFAVAGDTGRLDSHAQRLGEFKPAQIDHADRIAFAVCDVGILTKCRSVARQRLFAEIPPADPAENRQKYRDEEEFSQGRYEMKSLPKRGMMLLWRKISKVDGGDVS